MPQEEITTFDTQEAIGNVKTSLFFPVMVKMFSPILLCNPHKLLRKMSVSARKWIHPLLKILVPLFMDYKQVIEDKNALLGSTSTDRYVQLPKEPVIWCVNHGFKDDIAASVHATRHSYLFFGSLPHFFNTFDGIALFVNGVILCNRKNREMKKAAYDLAVQSLKRGNDLTIYPEGVWNKTPDKLMLELWPGIYRMARETVCKIVPVIHYLPEPHRKATDNVTHTIIAEPIDIKELDEQEGLCLLRDTMATWYYLLMEKYGQTTRNELLKEYATADEAWEAYMSLHTGCVKYYDREIELCADYRSKQVVRPEHVWQSIADIQNIHAGNVAHVRYAQALVAQERKRDFQRRF